MSEPKKAAAIHLPIYFPEGSFEKIPNRIYNQFPYLLIGKKNIDDIGVFFSVPSMEQFICTITSLAKQRKHYDITWTEDKKKGSKPVYQMIIDIVIKSRHYHIILQEYDQCNKNWKFIDFREGNISKYNLNCQSIYLNKSFCKKINPKWKIIFMKDFKLSEWLNNYVRKHGDIFIPFFKHVHKKVTKCDSNHVKLNKICYLLPCKDEKKDKITRMVKLKIDRNKYFMVYEICELDIIKVIQWSSVFLMSMSNNLVKNKLKHFDPNKCFLKYIQKDYETVVNERNSKSIKLKELQNQYNNMVKMGLNNAKTTLNKFKDMESVKLPNFPTETTVLQRKSLKDKIKDYIKDYKYENLTVIDNKKIINLDTLIDEQKISEEDMSDVYYYLCELNKKNEICLGQKMHICRDYGVLIQDWKKTGYFKEEMICCLVSLRLAGSDNNDFRDTIVEIDKNCVCDIRETVLFMAGH